MKTIWTAAQRADTIRAMRRQLDRLTTDDQALAARATADRPDGWPRTTSRGGSRGGHGDPTGTAVAIRLTHADESNAAVQAYALLWQASRLLEQADSQRARALPPATPEPDNDTWCASCLRAGHCTPRTPRQGGRQDLCTWCQKYWYAEGQLPARDILNKHHRGIRITEPMIRHARTAGSGSVSAEPGKRRDV